FVARVAFQARREIADEMLEQLALPLEAVFHALVRILNDDVERARRPRLADAARRARRHVVAIAGLDPVGDPLRAAEARRGRIPERSSLHRARARAVAEQDALLGSIARPEHQIDGPDAVVAAGRVTDLDRARRRQLEAVRRAEDFDPRRRVRLDGQMMAARLAN